MKVNVKKLLREAILNELRVSLLDYIKSKVPNVPEYVVKDFFYPSLKDASPDQIEEFIEEYGNLKWVLEKDFPINLETLGQDTINHLNLRAGGTKNPYGVPSDTKRHEMQQDLIGKRGLPTEPIIMVFENDKYELLEGWHRTIQLFKVYPDGFNYPNVYVGYK